MWNRSPHRAPCKIQERGLGGQSVISGRMLCFAPFDSNGEYMTVADDDEIIGMCHVDIEVCCF